MSVEALQDRLGYRFVELERLQLALTHRSWAHERGGPDNERLEFLGDAVLQTCSTVLLMERFPEAREGELSRLRSQVVSTPALAAVGRDLALGDLLQLGVGEEQTGGRQRRRVLACATEAVLGAIFLDGGLEASLDVVRRWLGPRVGALDAGAPIAWKDPRSRLQELTQSSGGATPTYLLREQVGPAHALVFVVDVLRGAEVLGRGEGSSKREASRRAAEAALCALGVHALDEVVEPEEVG
jgi:ribonuclease-3